MMSKLQELIAQREALDKQIAETRKNELREAIRTVQSLVTEFDLTSADVFGSARTDKKADKRTGRKVAPIYRDPATGKTWTGRGRAPTWLEGKDKDKFLITA
jgi:DNA-binding protein H-NS